VSRKSATKAEKAHMRRVAELGCCVCAMPAEVHHCGTYMGGGRDNMKVIPLCPTHHRAGGYGVAIHAGKTEWQRAYGTEEDILKYTELILTSV
jgi:hypothetical protein